MNEKEYFEKNVFNIEKIAKLAVKNHIENYADGVVLYNLKTDELVGVSFSEKYGLNLKDYGVEIYRFSKDLAKFDVCHGCIETCDKSKIEECCIDDIMNYLSIKYTTIIGRFLKEVKLSKNEFIKDIDNKKLLKLYEYLIINEDVTTEVENEILIRMVK